MMKGCWLRLTNIWLRWARSYLIQLLYRFTPMIVVVLTAHLVLLNLAECLLKSQLNLVLNLRLNNATLFILLMLIQLWYSMLLARLLTLLFIKLHEILIATLVLYWSSLCHLTLRRILIRLLLSFLIIMCNFLIQFLL
jgi:hypothetical protein